MAFSSSSVRPEKFCGGRGGGMLNGGGIGMKSEGGGGGNGNRLFAGVVVLVDVAFVPLAVDGT